MELIIPIFEFVDKVNSTMGLPLGVAVKIL